MLTARNSPEFFIGRYEAQVKFPEDGVGFKPKKKNLLWGEGYG